MHQIKNKELSDTTHLLYIYNKYVAKWPTKLVIFLKYYKLKPNTRIKYNPNIYSFLYNKLQ